jgi:hypothetical protein
MAEPGSVLLSPRAGGAPTSIKLVELGEKEIEVKTDKALPAPFALHVADREFAMTERDGKTYLPASILHFNFRPEWTISGYALSTKGWLDPTELLAKMKANRTAAAYGAMPKLPKRKP